MGDRGYGNHIKCIHVKRVEELRRNPRVAALSEMYAALDCASVKPTGTNKNARDLEISSAHVHTKIQVIRAILRTDVNRANVGVKERLVVDAGCLHPCNHLVIAEVAESGIVDLDMAWRGCEHGVQEKRLKTYGILGRTIL